MSRTISLYSDNASKFAEQYESVGSASVHEGWLNLLPQSGAILDVGAGSGLDAKYFAEKGLSVMDVDPAQQLREFAKKTHAHTQHSLAG